MILYFVESDGDNLAIDSDTNRHYRDTLGVDQFEGRAAAIAGLVGSVCTTAISRMSLDTACVRVSRADVPAEWLTAIGL